MLASATVLFIFIATLIGDSNGQCADSSPPIASTTTNEMTISLTSCSDNKFYLDISTTLLNTWFGIVFPPSPTPSSNMKGAALVYTKGKTNADTEQLWAYTNTGGGLGSTSKNGLQPWTEKTNQKSGSGIVMAYSITFADALSVYGWDANTVTIKFNYVTAKTETLQLTQQGHNFAVPGTIGVALNFPTTEPSKAPTVTTNIPTSTTNMPSISPSRQSSSPSKNPTISPNNDPTASPSKSPSINPSKIPTGIPSASPTVNQFVACGSVSVVDAVTLTVQRRISDQMIEISIAGPVGKWFAFGFGTEVMLDSYAIVLSGANSDVAQRTLPASNMAGANSLGTLLSGGSVTVTTDGSITTMTVVRAYTVEGEFDFTDFMTCQTETLKVISAKGSSLVLAYHSSMREKGSLTRTCECGNTDETTTSAPGPSTAGAGANNIFNPFYVIVALCIGLYFVA